MKVTNSSALPDAVVKAVVRFAADQREIGHYVQRVRVMATKWGWSGRCWGREQEIRVGAPTQFPITRTSKYANGPTTYEVRDPVEALAMVAGHEMQHSRQFMAQREQQFPAPRRIKLSEVDAERFGLAVLLAFRDRREQILGPAVAQQERADARRSDRQRAAADRAARAGSPEAAIARLEARIKEWTTRERRARTWRKKYERKLARARRAA